MGIAIVPNHTRHGVDNLGVAAGTRDQPELARVAAVERDLLGLVADASKVPHQITWIQGCSALIIGRSS